MKLCPTCGAEYADEQKFCPRDGTALRSTAQSGLVDSVIADRYHIEKKLGEGGMGAVYLGEHVKMGRKSAIKVMSPAMAADPDAIARFNREAANAARINHPNVCQIYDFGETADGTIYLAMELIEGESLGDVLEREGRLPVPRAVAILKQTADALQAAHDLGIVHRDLKPDNIMLARGRGGAETVKVVDFGIAKAMSGEEGQQVTKTGLVVGTPEYMSPEQLSGDKLDGRSDIYALALVFFRCLTGTFPFQAESTQEMMIKRLTDEPLPLNVAEPGAGYPDALQRVLDRALARMPADRYAGAVQFATEAATAARGMRAQPAAGAATQLLGTSEAAAALPPTEVRTSERRPVPNAAPRTPTTPQPPPSPPRPARRRAPVLAIAAAVVIVGGGATAFMLLRGGGGAGGGAGLAADTNRLGEQPGSTAVATGGGPARADTAGTGAAARPVADSTSLQARINRLTDPFVENESAVLGADAVNQLVHIYRDSATPPTLRGVAARMIMRSYQNATQYREACLWADRALRFPMEEVQRSGLDAVRQMMRCGS